jgi:hypothetical protein
MSGILVWRYDLLFLGSMDSFVIMFLDCVVIPA